MLLMCVAGGHIEDVAKDFDANWMTAVAAVADDTYLGADQFCNICTARRNVEAATEEEKARLDVVGVYHVGEHINRFRHGSLVMREADELATCTQSTEMTDADPATLPTLLFGTVNGVIGVVAQLPPRLFALFESLQKAMQKTIHGVGGLAHVDWRSFTNEHTRRTQESRGFIDGDLVEMFLDLPRDKMEEVVTLMNVRERGAPRPDKVLTVDELIGKVEDVQRIH